MEIAVDAMGGDHAPGAIVEGVVNYLKDDKDVCLVLVGKKRLIKRELKKNNFEIMGYQKVWNKNLARYPFPKLIGNYLKNNID